MGDFTARDESGAITKLEDLVLDAQGIQRLAVMRADVDDLGKAFIRGFVREGEEQPNQYLTLSRTAGFSRHMSLFFKYYINDILANGRYQLGDIQRTGKISVVYSGGDDMFLVGPWQEVVCASIDLRHAFAEFTGNALTLSAGIGIFDPSYPISQMARETGRLEEEAKAYVSNGHQKDALSLFGMEPSQEPHAKSLLVNRHTYGWDIFENKVLGEKYALIDFTLKARKGEIGNSFLYGILELLRDSSESRLNIARLAYLLSRRECPRNAEPQKKAIYDDFKKCIHGWAMSEEDRKQLVTALMIYVYAHREKGGSENAG